MAIVAPQWEGRRVAVPNVVMEKSSCTKFLSGIQLRTLNLLCKKLEEQVMRSFDDASSRRLFNWGRRHVVPPKSNHGRVVVEKRVLIGLSGSRGRSPHQPLSPKSADKNGNIFSTEQL
jgi:hypothetical protein